MSANQRNTESTVSNHLQAFFHKDVDGIVQDYIKESVLILPTGPLQGPSEIRKFFAGLIETMPSGFLEAFKLHKKVFLGEIGYIVWEARPWVQLATDTFFIRDGKIATQTFASYPALR